ncbi:SgcJ/EcaC family oxidoreductase [Phaeovulum sp.]|uniref:SgcJ/EcaC family oxidoreductase n=1 Tax=Phaeovulum sp. TaxID=2934796 RepID=UPI0035616B32
MSLAAPADLARAFAAVWAARDAEALAALFAEDGDFISLTGGAAEGRAAIAELVAAEFAGAFARARLVTGRVRVRPLGPHAAVVLQRFVLSGLVHADGSDAGRLGTVLAATLAATPQGWLVVAAQFVPEA